MIRIYNNSTNKYLQIYNQLKEKIVSGELKPNDRLPTIRQVAKECGVNNSTVVKAYELLETEGFIYKVTGSGTYVSPQIGSRGIGRLLYRDDTIRLDSGNPSGDMFPIEDFRRAINLALDDYGSSIFEYADGLGSIELRKRLTDYLMDLNIKSDPDRIQIISGAQQGIDIACKALISNSDIVFVEEPTYNGAIEVFKSRWARLIPVPMLNDGIDIGILKLKLERLRPKLLYTMPNFQNPTGITYSEYKKKKLLELAEEYDFYILEDDFMSDFGFDAENHRTIKSYDRHNRVIYIKSFSKILMPGLRLGLMDVPEELLEVMVNAKYATDINTSGLIQGSLLHFMDCPDWNKYLAKLERKYTEKYRTIKALLEEKLDKRLELTESSGGINFFVTLPRGVSSHAFCEFMLERGVALLNGGHFYDNSPEEHHFRINIAKESVERIKRAIELINLGLDDFLGEKRESEIKSNSIYY